MKKFVSIVLLLCFSANIALAECDFKTGIKPVGDGTFNYTGECHRHVGDLVQDNKVKETQIADLFKAIELKDLAIKKADERTQLWMDTSSKMEDRINKADELQSKNHFIYFGLGIAAAALSVWGASQLIRR